jgi:hypothetical protein
MTGSFYFFLPRAPPCLRLWPRPPCLQRAPPCAALSSGDPAHTRLSVSPRAAVPLVTPRPPCLRSCRPASGVPAPTLPVTTPHPCRVHAGRSSVPVRRCQASHKTRHQARCKPGKLQDPPGKLQDPSPPGKLQDLSFVGSSLLCVGGSGATLLHRDQVREAVGAHELLRSPTSCHRPHCSPACSSLPSSAGFTAPPPRALTAESYVAGCSARPGHRELHCRLLFRDIHSCRLELPQGRRHTACHSHWNGRKKRSFFSFLLF